MALKSSLLAAASLMAYLPASNGAATEMSGASYLEYATATYNLVSTYDSSNFFSEFSLFSGADPTGGFVAYQGDESTAQSAGLINTNNNQVYMGVDYTDVVSTSSAGRASIRVSSNTAYTHGLFIADIAHMPGSICGYIQNPPYLKLILTKTQDVACLLDGRPQLAQRWRNRHYRGG
jgi:hypothetical protein